MSSLTIVGIDKVRSRAHRAGWKDAGYNPFGRVRSHEQADDVERQQDEEEEEQHRHVNFDSSATRPVDDDAPKSPKRTDTEKDENVSGSTDVDDGIDSTGISKRSTGKENGNAEAAPQFVPLTDSQREEERKRARHEMLKRKIPVVQQIKTVLFPRWYSINWLLICAPVGIALNYVKGINPLAIFIVNFIAIIPLAGILSFATEELAMRVGETLGGLLNATFGYVDLPNSIPNTLDTNKFAEMPSNSLSVLLLLPNTRSLSCKRP